MQITIDSKKYREMLFSRKKENFGKFIRKTYGNVFADLMKANAIRKIVLSSSGLSSVIPFNISYNEVMSLSVPSSWLKNFKIDEIALASFGVILQNVNDKTNQSSDDLNPEVDPNDLQSETDRISTDDSVNVDEILIKNPGERRNNHDDE